MFVLDPKQRPTSAECLSHPFISELIIDDETVMKKRPNSLEDQTTRQESKSTEKTYMSNISTTQSESRHEHIL